jgi:hypothetical protein
MEKDENQPSIPRDNVKNRPNKGYIIVSERIFEIHA